MDRDECLGLEDVSPQRSCPLTHQSPGADRVDEKLGCFPNRGSWKEGRRGSGSGRQETPLTDLKVQAQSRSARDITRKVMFMTANSQHPHNFRPLHTGFSALPNGLSLSLSLCLSLPPPFSSPHPLSTHTQNCLYVFCCCCYRAI